MNHDNGKKPFQSIRMNLIARRAIEYQIYQLCPAVLYRGFLKDIIQMRFHDPYRNKHPFTDERI
jgi:hypothetical protein